jgi:hypothetical protein
MRVRTSATSRYFIRSTVSPDPVPVAVRTTIYGWHRTALR